MILGTGLTFRERMAGGFTLGETDPAAGARASAGTMLTLVARVVIPDVARFVADPEHAGQLDGLVTFASIGQDVPAPRGQVKLFTPTADPNLKLMAYRVTFEHEGRRYCLDGTKYVRRESVLRAWRATTTLPCRLHAGLDPAAAVVGAGILRLTPASLVGQLASFGTLNARTPVEKARTIATFLRFFSGELLDTYVGRARDR